MVEPRCAVIPSSLPGQVELAEMNVTSMPGWEPDDAPPEEGAPYWEPDDDPEQNPEPDEHPERRSDDIGPEAESG